MIPRRAQQIVKDALDRQAAVALQQQADDLKAEVADLQSQKDALTGYFSTPDAAVVIDRVRTEMAGRPKRERARRLPRQPE